MTQYKIRTEGTMTLTPYERTSSVYTLAFSFRGVGGHLLHADVTVQFFRGGWYFPLPVDKIISVVGKSGPIKGLTNKYLACSIAQRCMEEWEKEYPDALRELRIEQSAVLLSQLDTNLFKEGYINYDFNYHYALTLPPGPERDVAEMLIYEAGDVCDSTPEEFKSIVERLAQ